MIKTWMMKLLGMTHGGLTCREVGEILQQYLDGHIDADRAGRIEIHLEERRRCGLEAETDEHITATLAAQRPEIPEESLTVYVRSASNWRVATRLRRRDRSTAVVEPELVRDWNRSLRGRVSYAAP